MKVLIVEDGFPWNKILPRWFEELGHEVVGIATNKADALRLLREHQPVLVTMDGTLDNGQTGLDIADAMRAENSGVAIVMIAGHPNIKFEGRGFCKNEITIDGLCDFLAQLFPWQ